MGFLSKKKKNEPEIEEKRSGGVLAVWGSPGSGKTTVSVKLAEYLSRKGNNVLLVFCDMNSGLFIPAKEYNVGGWVAGFNKV